MKYLIQWDNNTLQTRWEAEAHLHNDTLAIEYAKRVLAHTDGCDSFLLWNIETGTATAYLVAKLRKLKPEVTAEEVKDGYATVD